MHHCNNILHQEAIVVHQCNIISHQEAIVVHQCNNISHQEAIVVHQCNNISHQDNIFVWFCFAPGGSTALEGAVSGNRTDGRARGGRVRIEYQDPSYFHISF